MYPFVLIILGIAVLLFGQRLAILGAAVGGLVGVVLATFFPEATLSTQLLLVLGLALAGFMAAAFARGIIEVIILVLGALGGAAVVLALLSLFNIDEGLLNLVLAVVGGVIGLMLIRRSRRGRRDWGMIILADLVGALLIVRGLVLLLNLQRDSLLYTLLLVGLLAVGILFQGGYLRTRPRAGEPMPAEPADTLPTGPIMTPPVRADVAPPTLPSPPAPPDEPSA